MTWAQESGRGAEGSVECSDSWEAIRWAVPASSDSWEAMEHTHECRAAHAAAARSCRRYGSDAGCSSRSHPLTLHLRLHLAGGGLALRRLALRVRLPLLPHRLVVRSPPCNVRDSGELPLQE